MNFWIPCLGAVAVFWISFAIVYCALRGRMTRLERRIQRVECTMQGKQTEDFPKPLLQPHPAPRAPRPRYVTVDRGIKPQWEQ